MPGAGAEVGPGLYGATSGGGGGAVSSVSNSDGTLTVSPTTGAVVASIPSSVALPGSPTTTTQAAGDNSTKIATDAFVTTAVNNAIAGVNPAVAVQAATTAASDTSGFTYNNGVGGIGATLTGSVNTAVTIDGFTFTALGQRLLVKNDTQSPSGAFNGIYYVTQLQSGILAPVLTRALDYDSPSDMNNTGVIPVINGTVNGTTTWVLTSQVVTVGTTPLTYVQFSYNPSQIVQSFNTRNGAVTLSAADVEATFGAKGQILVGTGSGTGALLGVGSDTQVLTADSSQADGIKWAAPASGGGLAIFGDGSDGAVTFDGTTTILGIVPNPNSAVNGVYTLARDIFLASSTLNSGISIVTNGYRIFCAGTFTNNGTIQWNGAAGGNGTTVGGSAGAAVSNASSSINISTTTSSPGAPGAAGSTGSGGPGSNQNARGHGGNGGHGGAGSSGGGAGGTADVPLALQGDVRSIPGALGYLVSGGASLAVLGGGGGGGGGGGDATNAGGGGGSGGAVVILLVKTFAGTGTISANGGNGGNGNGTGVTGGGGGGGGGTVIVTSGSVSGGAISGQTITANGGTHGTSNSTGGGSITNGNNGTVILIPN